MPTKWIDRADLRHAEARGQQEADKADAGVADRMREVDIDKDTDRKSGDKSKGGKKWK